MIKKLGFVFLIGIIAVLVTPVDAYARRGDMGFFGGISEGRRLPRTTETILLEQGGRNGRNGNGTISMNYRELVFLGGRPVQFDGIIEVNGGSPAQGSTSGTFPVTYRVRPSDATSEDVSITRNMNFTVYYRVEDSQLILFYDINTNNWSEVITTPEGTFTLDPQRSSFVVSIIEDRTPGVTYYRGDISARMVFVDEAGEIVIMDQTGEFYGFNSAWAATETHRMDVSIINGDWALQYQIRPSVSVNKILQFVHNEPTVISFEGNYREVHQSFAGLMYDIFGAMPHFMWDEPRQGTLSLETVNVFEQLPAPNHLGFLRGHSAEDDIHRLFAMQVLQGDPRFFVPEQAITRGQFMTALARAIKLPVEPEVQARGRREPVTVSLFTDVDSNRPEFRYIQAIQRAGVAFGRADGKFYFDYPIQRQEAFATVIRALGLTNLGLDPTVITPFLDSDRIAYWAIREMAVANMLGIIGPDANGNIVPTQAISNAEAAALFNHLIEYMRNGLVSDYGEQIVNIAR